MYDRVRLDGSTTFNSYITLAQANTLLANRIGYGNWASSSNTDVERTAALIMSFQYMATEEWVGIAKHSNQVEGWPRKNYWEGAEFVSNSGDSDNIPHNIALAQAVRAGHILKNKDTFFDGLSNVKSVSWGGISASLDSSVQSVPSNPRDYKILINEYVLPKGGFGM